jgi:hypothetical protein
MTPLPKPRRPFRTSGTYGWFGAALFSVAALWLSGAGCAAVKPTGQLDILPDAGHDDVASAAHGAGVAPKARALSPVPLWKDGKTSGELDLAEPPAARDVVLDLGEQWVPYIFSEHSATNETLVPQSSYRATYLALARGEYPNDHHGLRAKKDRYLELYGILPTLGLLRTRFHEAVRQDCASKIDLEPLKQYQRIVPYIDNPKARRDSSQFLGIEQRIKQVMAKQGVDAPSKLDASRLSAGEKNALKQYEKVAPTALVIRAAQVRLACEGFFDAKTNYTDGALDWATNEAIALFERKHRIFGWGFISHDTVEALKEPPLEGERQAVVRVLTERAMHAAGFIEDGSTSRGDKPQMFRGKDGKEHAVPNLEKQLREDIIKAFGLETPESTLAWLDSLGDVSGEKFVALEGPERPEYQSPNMELSVVVDRGDIWYEFPYDDQGKERAQPVQRRPTLTLFTDYLGEKIPLARFGTTVGGWRSELIDGTEMWKYKGSPVGQRVWKQIVAAPVWLAPPGTPVRTLVIRDFRSKTGYAVNLHEIGPSYASAYGLVAAYHSRFKEGDDGELEIQGDEGIRTHGSVDYMSIMQRHSHGCHRLHNHIAMRLMSFVLAHRSHVRIGQKVVAYKNTVKNTADTDDTEYVVDIPKTGYIFQLERPVPVDVLPGRVRGTKRTPITAALPKFDATLGAYAMPDGSTVKIDRNGEITPVAPPPAPAPAADVDAGVAPEPVANP